MKMPKHTITKDTFDLIIKRKGMKEAKKDVYVDRLGTLVFEVLESFTIGDVEWISFLNRKISINNIGYRQCGCKGSTTLVHRLVASAFVDNPNNYKEVDHIDGNKTNNNMNNLKWVSHSENMKRAWDNGQISRTHDVKARYIKKSGLLKLQDGTSIKMTWEEYLNWRLEHGLRVYNMIKDN